MRLECRAHSRALYASINTDAARIKRRRRVGLELGSPGSKARSLPRRNTQEGILAQIAGPGGGSALAPSDPSNRLHCKPSHLHSLNYPTPPHPFSVIDADTGARPAGLYLGHERDGGLYQARPRPPQAPGPNPPDTPRFTNTWPVPPPPPPPHPTPTPTTAALLESAVIRPPALRRPHARHRAQPPASGGSVPVR